MLPRMHTRAQRTLDRRVQPPCAVEEARRASIAARRLSSEESAAQAASPLDASNRGHRMLERLGWEIGSGLGARQDGEVLPVAIRLSERRGAIGLGRSAGQEEQAVSGWTRRP